MTKIPDLPNSTYEDTLVHAIQMGKGNGYLHEFEFNGESLWVQDKPYSSEAIRIDGMRRFEGMSNPADSMIYYQLSTDDGRKGYFVSAFGSDANAAALQFLNRCDQLSR